MSSETLLIRTLFHAPIALEWRVFSIVNVSFNTLFLANVANELFSLMISLMFKEASYSEKRFRTVLTTKLSSMAF